MAAALVEPSRNRSVRLFLLAQPALEAAQFE